MSKIKLINSIERNKIVSTDTDEYNNYYGFAMIIGIVVMCSLFLLGNINSNNETGLLGGKPIYNYVVFVGGFFMGMSSSIIILLYYKKRVKKLHENKKNHVYVLSILYLLCLFIAFIVCNLIYRYDDTQFDGGSAQNLFIRYSINPFILNMIIVTTSYVISVIAIHTQVKKNSKLFRYMISVMVSIVAGSILYMPNMFMQSYSALYHEEAYINSIINVMHHIPYDDVATSIYGRYGLIFYPFVKILGDNTKAIAMTIAFFSGIIIFCLTYICGKLIKNDFLFLITACTLLSFFCICYKDWHYWQMTPGRELFPAITLALICYEEFHSNIPRWIVWILDVSTGALAFLFNFESGLVCVIVLLIHHYISSCVVAKKSINFIVSIFAACSSLLLAFFIFNMYNLASGGKWESFLIFIFPIGSNVYQIEDLRAFWPPLLTGYLPVVIVFFLSLLKGLSDTIRRTNDYSSKTVMNVSLSLMGIGLFFYYVNRTAIGNASISWLFFLCLIGMKSERIIQLYPFNLSAFIKNPGKMFDFVETILAILLSSYFLIEGICGCGIAIRNYAESAWNTESLETTLEQFRERVPKDTPGFGLGIPTMYYYLGWDTHSYTIDFSDMNEIAKNAISKEMQNWDSFVATYTEIPGMEDFDLVENIDVDNFSCGYYVRKNIG